MKRYVKGSWQFWVNDEDDECPCQKFSPEIDEDAAFELISDPPLHSIHSMCNPWVDENGNLTKFFHELMIDILEASPPINKYIH